MPLPIAEIVHASEGRTRLRFSAHRGAADELAALATRLGKLDKVHSVAVRPITGSVLVLHDGDFAEIARRAQSDDLFAIGAVDERTGESTLRVRDPIRALAALAFAGLGVKQLLGNHVLPPALTLFWYAASLARELAEGEMPPESDDD